MDLSHTKHYQWTVLPFFERRGKNTVWLCECECGVQKWLRQHDIRSGKRNRCPECWMSLRGSRHGNWKGCGDISGHRWSEIQRCASRRGITFDITLQQAWTQFIDQNGRCAITGVEINFKERTASLDRIDSTRGYMLENIQWVHKIVNQMKWSLSDQELLEWCQRVVNYADHRSVSV